MWLSLLQVESKVVQGRKNLLKDQTIENEQVIKIKTLKDTTEIKEYG